MAWRVEKAHELFAFSLFTSFAWEPARPMIVYKAQKMGSGL
jgi:hypothetical protein